MTAPIDAERLRFAITSMRERMRASMARRFSFDDLRLDAVLTAAEAYLATLPALKTRWRVTGEGKRIAQSESFSTRDAAGRFAAYLVESGYDHIVIQAEQVPG